MKGPITKPEWSRNLCKAQRLGVGGGLVIETWAFGVRLGGGVFAAAL